MGPQPLHRMTRTADRSEADFIFKILIIGDSTTGKTNITSQLVSGKFNRDSLATIGVEFGSIAFKSADGRVIKCHIWDTAGQERYRAMNPAYYRGASGAVILYDVTNRGSFESVSRWLKELQDHCADRSVAKILVGNKTDLRDLRRIGTEEGIALAEREGLAFMEASALTRENVEEAFVELVNKVYSETSKGSLAADATKPAGLPTSTRQVRITSEQLQPQVPLPPKADRSMCCN